MTCVLDAPTAQTDRAHPAPDDDGVELLRRRQYGTTAAERHQARQDAITYYLEFATTLSRRFRQHGVPDGDLAQIAAMALIKAVDRFDIERGSRFEAFLAPTVVGELKRYFRDHTWAVRMPRRLQELALGISEANGRLAQQLGRSPTVRDLAEDLGVEEEQILEGLECSWSYSCAPLNTTAAGDDYASARGPDPGMEQVDNWQSLRPLLRQLPRRERQILEMRFIGEMTQTQIAARIGVSQMQVSRLLAQCLAQLRHRMLADS